jgi:hypothetical protein
MARLVLATILAAAVVLPASAQRMRVDPNSGKYVAVPDRFDEEWPQADVNAPNPNSVTKSVTRRLGSGSAAASAGGAHAYAPDQSAQLQSMGGMSTYRPNSGSSTENTYPDWWPK